MSATKMKTSAVLAAMHSFPAIMAAREGCCIIEAFDELRQLTVVMATEGTQDHLGWCTVSEALRPSLKDHFSALATETIPDLAYWNGPKGSQIDPDKMAALGAWVEGLEKKYGEVLEIPDFSVQIKARLKL